MKTTRLLLSTLLACSAAVAVFERDARADTYTTRADTFCYDTTQPQLILQNDVAKLWWNNTGDLYLVNFAGDAVSSTKWGMGSAVPLTDPNSNTATLCYGSGGNLKIKDHAGNVVWQSSTTTTSDNNNLALNECTLKVRHDAGTKWSKGTDECSYTTHDNNAGQGWCKARPTSANTRIVWDVEAAAELDWQTDGNLVLYATDGRGAQWASNTGGNVGSSLCFQSDGNLVVYKADGTAAWAAGTDGDSVSTLKVDSCGVALSDGTYDIWRQGSGMCSDLPANKQSIAILSRFTQEYVSAENAGASSLVPNRTIVGPWETFQFVNLGNGNVAIKSLINGRYVTGGDPNTPLIANRTSVGAWETFQWISLPGGDFALKASTGYYVGVFYGVLFPAAYAIGPWQTFHWQPTAVPTAATTAPVSLKARANDHYVTAENAGTSPLIANRTAVGLWEEFRLVDLGGGNVAIRSLVSNSFVTAENGGASALIANRASVGAWETFQWIDLGNNDFALRAVNGKYVSAENAGANALLADRTAVGTWETFNWQPASDTPTNSLTGGGFSFVYDKRFGNSDFGAEMWIVGSATNAAGLAGLRASVPSGSAASSALDKLIPATGTTVPSGFAEVLGSAGASATLFAQNLTILDVGGYVGDSSGLSSKLTVTAAGTSIYSGSLVTGAGGTYSATYGYSLEKAFIEHDQQLMIGPIPVTLHADVTGTIGVSSTLTVTTTAPFSLSSVTTPSLNLTVNASAAVGTAFVSAGVEGSLTLLDLSVPLNLSYSSAGRTFNASNSLNVATLDGSIDLFAQVKVDLGIYSYEKKYTKGIASWDGYAWNKVLLSTSGSL
jgi:hypothetical protein